MLKLLRNNWATLGQIKDSNDNIINYNLIEKLDEIQEKEL